MRNLKKFLALVLAMMMTLSLMVTVNAKESYPDLDKADEAFVEAIDVLSGVGVIRGDETGNYNPRRGGGHYVPRGHRRREG